MIQTILRWGVFVSFILALAFLTVLVMQTLSFGRRRLHSQAGGSRWKGMIYAFGRGMLPWEKESAARHLPTYVAGLVYHAGIFAAIALALAQAAGIHLPNAAVSVIRISMAAGLCVGAGLLLKRLTKSQLRHISCPDDYAANILVDGFILAGLLSSWLPAALPVFHVAAIVTFLYMPLGKIRHCFFFFYSRFLFGSYFGRRGVLPPKRAAKA